MAQPAGTASISFREERYPPYDAAHGTPHEMVRRVLEKYLAGGG